MKLEKIAQKRDWFRQSPWSYLLAGSLIIAETTLLTNLYINRMVEEKIENHGVKIDSLENNLRNYELMLKGGHKK